MTVNCPHCGAELAEGARFCKYCGKPIETPAPEKKKSGIRKGLLIAVPVILLISAGGWTAYSWYAAQDRNSADEGGQVSVNTALPEHEAESSGTAEPEEIHEAGENDTYLNLVLDHISEALNSPEYIQQIQTLIRSDEYKKAVIEMRKNGSDRYIRTLDDSRSLGIFFADEQYMVYIGGYDQTKQSREGHGEWIGADVMFADIPYKTYTASGEWENDKPNGSWKIESAIRSGYDGSLLNITEIGNVKDGLWDGEVQSAENGAKYTYQFSDGLIRYYDSFYENGERLDIVQYMNGGYVYQMHDLATDYRGVGGYSRGN